MSQHEQVDCTRNCDAECNGHGWRKQDSVGYQRASRFATKVTLARHKRSPFRDEDEMIEYMREIRSDNSGW